MESIPQWARDLRAAVGDADPERLGTVRHIDDAARERGFDSIVQRRPFALGRVPEPDEGWNVELEAHDHGAFVGISDNLMIACHGTKLTHIDGLNHVGADDWYAAPGDDGPTALSQWADARILTRGVLVDIPDLRGTDWVAVDEPVTGEEIEQSLASTGTRFESGDSLLIYMGRDRFESTGGVYKSTVAASNGRSGVGVSAVQWIADNKVAVLNWDFMDARNSDGAHAFAGHMLVWAIGLVLVDNSHLAGVAENARATNHHVGMYSVSFPAFSKVSGLAVNPLFIA